MTQSPGLNWMINHCVTLEKTVCFPQIMTSG